MEDKIHTMQDANMMLQNAEQNLQNLGRKIHHKV